MKAQGGNHGFGRKFLGSEDRVRKQFLLHKETGELGMYNVGGGITVPLFSQTPGMCRFSFLCSEIFQNLEHQTSSQTTNETANDG